MRSPFSAGCSFAHARGIDLRSVVPRALPGSATVRYRFDRHVLDGAELRAALLELVVRLGHLLRRRGQPARALTLTLSFAGDGRRAAYYWIRRARSGPGADGRPSPCSARDRRVRRPFGG
ncbi:DinB/UmuC family translesion DNA polymerase [Streptomyces mirabilis]|uniref:DinB/UmuC family translesion DNA polymerase n=1 Tax=Streptomyces mirabilis TaxID=68239 RepID=UPI003653D2A2